VTHPGCRSSRPAPARQFRTGEAAGQGDDRRWHDGPGRREACGVRSLQRRFAWDVPEHGGRKAPLKRSHSKRFATSPLFFADRTKGDGRPWAGLSRAFGPGNRRTEPKSRNGPPILTRTHHPLSSHGSFGPKTHIFSSVRIHWTPMTSTNTRLACEKRSRFLCDP